MISGFASGLRQDYTRVACGPVRLLMRGRVFTAHRIVGTLTSPGQGLLHDGVHATNTGLPRQAAQGPVRRRPRSVQENARLFRLPIVVCLE